MGTKNQAGRKGPVQVTDMRQREVRVADGEQEANNAECGVCGEPIQYGSDDPAQSWHYKRKLEANVHQSCVAAINAQRRRRK